MAIVVPAARTGEIVSVGHGPKPSNPDLALIARRLHRIDRELMRRSVRARTPRLDRALVQITRTANYSRLWLLIAGMLASCGGASGRRAARAGVSAIVIASSLANGPAKLLVRRRRPPNEPGWALIDMPRSTSFPSGHSASAFAFATATSRELPMLAPVLTALASAVSYSRVHTGVHYPSDVTAGAVIGIASGLLTRRFTGSIGDWARSPLVRIFPYMGEDRAACGPVRGRACAASRSAHAPTEK